jgi:hypothetical protein
MLLLPEFIEKFANSIGMWIVFIAGCAFTLYQIFKKKDTSPPGNLPNTGLPEPRPTKDPIGNMTPTPPPAPKPPYKEQV